MDAITVKNLSSGALVLLLALGILGCQSKTMGVKNEAVITPVTYSGSKLKHLPAPQGPIPIALYNFRDQTGQYKYQELVSSFSTAVTQGATSMLVKALQDSGWFVPLEREGLQDLLTERKIIRASRRNGDARPIPSLSEAKLLIQGGVIGYDTNVKTGGAGARYFGIGASTEYREDQVTVYLRAVDVNTGRVIHNVSTTKTVWSQELSAGVFRFVSFERLLELEAGFTTNEPAQLCVLEAIEKAVVGLVIEGAENGYWKFADPDAMNSKIVQDYIEERNQSRSLDPRLVENASI